MKKPICFLIFIINVIIIQSEVKGQLFDEPRRDGFKFVKNDDVDITSAEHFAASGILSVGFYKLFKTLSASASDRSAQAGKNMKSPEVQARLNRAKIKAGLLASSLGFLKEFEDGFREGFGIKDILFNHLGIVTFLLLSEYTHYTLTFNQVVSSLDNFGLGIRFFKSSEFTPLNASIGFFAYYDNYNETWTGIDIHFHLIGRTELNLGLAFVKLQAANQMNIQPNIGMGFKLF